MCGVDGPRAYARSATDTETQRAYERPEIVREYFELGNLFASEEHIFQRYLRDGTRILDLGVGAGRTTEVLAQTAATYVALDYSASMVEACQRAHPGRDVRVGDAVDLSMFDDESFDFVLFSYNGLDCLHPWTRRNECIAEISRVVASNGTVMLSSHHSRALARPRPDIDALGGGRIKALALQLYATARLLQRCLPSRALWRGEGYLQDPASGNTMYATTPRRVRREFSAHGLELVETVSSLYPRRAPTILVPWYYFVFYRAG